MCLLLFIAVLPGDLPSRPDLAWGAVAGLAGGTGVALLYRALAVGRMSVVAPTTAVCAVVIPVVAEALAGVRLAPSVVAGIAVALLAIVLVGQQDHEVQQERGAPARPRRSLSPGLGLAFLSGAAIGVFFLTLARTDEAAGLWPLVAARVTSAAAFTSLAIATSVPLRLPAPITKIAVVAGALDMGANALYLLATRVGSLSIAVTLCSLYPASTVLLARLVLGERLNRRQALGIACALAAIVLIVRGS